MVTLSGKGCPAAITPPALAGRWCWSEARKRRFIFLTPRRVRGRNAHRPDAARPHRRRAFLLEDIVAEMTAFIARMKTRFVLEDLPTL